MAKTMLADSDINTYRSSALFFTANSPHASINRPVYWNGNFKGVNSYALGEVLALKPKDMWAYYKGKGGLPEKFLLKASEYIKEIFKDENWTIGVFSEEEVLGEVSGQSFFADVAVPYIRDVVMKGSKRDIAACVPQEAVDKYGIQIAEMLLNGNDRYSGKNYKIVNFSTTDSKRFAEIHFAEIPMKKDNDGNNVPCEATGFIQFGMSDGHPLSADKEEFVSNIVDVINGNLTTYRNNMCPKVHTKFRKDTIYGAGILGKKL